MKKLSWFWLVPLALLLGTAVAFVILTDFWNLQEKFFPYSTFPKLNYLLGEVGGYLGPGLGLLTGGIVLLRSYHARCATEQHAPLGAGQPISALPAVASQQPRVLGFFLRFAAALMLGAGAGLLSGAATYLVLGVIAALYQRIGSASDLAGFMASGHGCLVAGIALLLVFGRAEAFLWVRRVIAACLMVAGLALCCMGIMRWLS